MKTMSCFYLVFTKSSFSTFFHDDQKLLQLVTVNMYSVNAVLRAELINVG